MPINLGLCCMNTHLRTKGIFSSRTCRLDTLKKDGFGFPHLKKLSMQNLDDLIKLLEWNNENGIKVFRMSSELFPHISNYTVFEWDREGAEEYFRLEWCRERLAEIGKRARELDIRLTFHPGQYNVVGSPNRASFNQTIVDLKYHADVLDLMGLDNNSVMVVHGGGHYGDKEKTLERWCKQYQELPENVRKRLVLENCEKCFSIKDCLQVSEKINIPVVFDTHHYDCYCKLHSQEKFEKPDYYIPKILKTWKRRNIKPKFHVSEQGSGRTGHHSDYIKELPNYLLEIPYKYDTHIDIMIEAKMKEQSILRLYKKYPFLICKKRIKIRSKIKKLKKTKQININNGVITNSKN